MDNLTKAVELLISLALCDNEEDKKDLLVSLKELSCGTAPYMSMEEVVEDMLTEIGMPDYLSGYEYLVYAICAIANNLSLRHNITTKLYPMIAEKFNSTRCGVERCIRHAIMVAFDRCDVDVVYKYFGNIISPHRGKPTNSEFLSHMAYAAKRRVGNV